MQLALCSSPRLALEPAAERRTWGRPSACWAGPEENMKMDGQPRKDNDEQKHARRPSKRPKKSGKQRRAREKVGTQMTIFPEPPPAAGGPDRQAQKTDFRQNANKFKPNGHLGAEVSVPNVGRKYAFGGILQTLQKKRAAAPEPTLQTKMNKIQI